MSGYIGTKAVTLSTTAATVTGSSTVGAGLTVDNDGATVLTVDRASTDGAIIDVQKNGSSIGGIGVAATDDVYFAGGTGSTKGIYLNDNGVLPATTGGSASDATVDLGNTVLRWKDLYLSGGVYLGGTGAANQLDDYEEGTWNPTSSLGTITVQGGATYTKIGNLVTIYADLRSFSERSSTDSVRINGLPFTAAKRSVGAVMYRYMSDIPTNGSIVAYVDSVNYVHFLSNGGIGNWRGTQYADLDSASSILAFTITYQI